MAGNGPINTYPIFASDETLFLRARGDYGTLATASELLAGGADGVIASGTPWTMTSESVDFQGQGVMAQNIIHLTQPASIFKGGRFFAVDSVAPNTVYMRMVNKPLNVGQPPVPAAGQTNITFAVNTFCSLLEDASWDLKSQFGIDEATTFRASPWIYQGAEDPYRDLRAATVLQVMIKAYSSENRTKDGDFYQKIAIFKKEYQDVLGRLQVRWGPFGNSEPPSTKFGCKISR